jgi:hypothetical protein
MPDHPSRVVAGLRRALPAFGLGALALVVAVPAQEDLDALLRAVGYLALLVGVLITLATVLRGEGA